MIEFEVRVVIMPPMRELLKWTESRIASDVQDPLGVELRVSARMTGQLLFCITTITPRVRYYSFLLWVIDEYGKSVRDTQNDLGLREWLRRYEGAFALGCTAACNAERPLGRGVVGRQAADAYWQRDGADPVNLARYRPKGILAWNQYGTSLVNLGLFNEIVPNDTDSEEGHEVGREIDILTLSELGLRISDAYRSTIADTSLTSFLRQADSYLPRSAATSFALRGGVDQSVSDDALDRKLLRDLLFNRNRGPGVSHELRRESLLLILALIKQAGRSGVFLDWTMLGHAVVFGRTASRELAIDWSVPPQLQRISRYWRMFYLHNHLAAGLEGLFVAVIKLVEGNRLGHATLEGIVDSLSQSAAATVFRDEFGMELERPFGSLSLRDLLASSQIDIADSSAWRSGQAAGPGSQICEARLSERIRERGWRTLSAEAGLSLSVLLALMACHRFGTMKDTDEGLWCGRNISDPYLDLSPPLVLDRLESWDPDWRSRALGDVSRFIIDRFIVRQHELLGFDKDASMDAMILHASDGMLSVSGDYESIMIGNPRLANAIQILKDLRLVSTDGLGLTEEGMTWLDEELQMLTT